MPFDSDIALLGTGVAPLVAAINLLAQGKSVLILNPDWDFFLEDSELSLDPLIPHPSLALNAKRLAKSWPERVLAELRPDFPGAVEFWTGTADEEGFHDPDAPHVRTRGRLWIHSDAMGPRAQGWDWESLEDLYVEVSDAGFNPQIWEGLQASKRFPGSAPDAQDIRGLHIPKLCDVDVSRYRNGLLEYVRERLGPSSVVSAATQIELMPGGVRFYSQGALRTARINEGILVFWTPRLTPWVMSQAKKFEAAPVRPRGVRLWEQWSLISRDVLDPSVIGIYGDMAVWAEAEGVPPTETHKINRLAVLRSGPLVEIGPAVYPQGNPSWASAESFGALTQLCCGFLRWEKFSVRSMRPRAIFEWENETPWYLTRAECPVQVVPACDGPLSDVVRVARSACQRITSEQKGSVK